jgi:hypothetical protein
MLTHIDYSIRTESDGTQEHGDSDQRVPRHLISSKLSTMYVQETANHFGAYTGPDDIYSEYTDRYGELSMFPAVDTEIGVL